MTEQQEPSFEQLLAEAEASRKSRVEIGERCEGKVIQISEDCAHIDIGLRSEGVLHFKGDPREAELKVGDAIPVFIAKTGYEAQLSLDPILGFGDMSKIEKAHESGEALEGKVESRNKGGFTINIEGVSCFCPISQIELGFVENPDVFIGETKQFKVLELEGDNVVVSHRLLKEEARDKAIAEVRSQMHEGAVLPAKVVKLTQFGAFMDLGANIQGLCHVSEMAHYRIQEPSDILAEGQTHDVKILSLELDARGKERISLSIKALIPDPWSQLELEKGQILKGSISKIKDFGVFIAVQEGVEGLLPFRYLRQEGESLDKDSLVAGQEIEVEIVEIVPDQKQITLAIPGWDKRPESGLKEGDALKAKVVKIIPAGVLVSALEDPARGLIPRSRLQHANFKTMENDFPIDKEFMVILESIDEKGRFNFRLQSDADQVDAKTLNQYVDSGDMSHNPFADFFKKG